MIQNPRPQLSDRAYAVRCWVGAVRLRLLRRACAVLQRGNATSTFPAVASPLLICARGTSGAPCNFFSVAARNLVRQAGSPDARLMATPFHPSDDNLLSHPWLYTTLCPLGLERIPPDVATPPRRQGR